MAEQLIPEFEEWREIPDFPDYAASNLGRIRRITDARNGTGGITYRAGYILKPGVGRTFRYPTVLIGGRSRRVSSLVCTTFHGPRPTGYVVAHFDGDPENNRADNLRWATQKENAQDTVRHGRTNRGIKCPMHKLTPDNVIEIRRLLDKGISQEKISEYFGVSRGAIKHIKVGSTWGWL